MALAWAHVSFTEELLCPVCLELFVDPVILSCGHNFCRQCVQEYWQRQAPGLCCPECREENDREGPLRPNQVVREMSEEARTLAGLYCHLHGLRYKLFCDTDLQLICVSCRDSPEHQQHEASPVQEAAQFYKEKLQEETVSLQDQSSAFTAFLDVEEDKISLVKKNVESLRQHIKEQFAQMHGFLCEREAALTHDLVEHERSILTLIRENLQKVQQGLSSLDVRLAELISQQAQGDDIEFLKELSQRRPDDIQLPTEAATDLPLGIFKGPLQYKIWKEMKDFISPAPEALTLDPESAHQRLLVSEDLTHVRLTDSNQQPQGPERFGPCVNILAAQGFRSGRHYWEVEVGAKTAWDLGVARESVRRKGRITLSPVDGYWTLWLRDGDQYKALDWPAVPLAPATRPRKVGIYLDFEGGQVSFYNADNMSHLYTFRDTFGERLFPYFSPYLTSCPGNAEGLRLCTLKL
ncbi:nuclear factor 7, ovary-like [Stegostoma tigrinum]|uniref:nuclear factor 7, ovary-like n=1 Tax=Stegostoma tigrinum TaxID=3053191 RepID=UPI00202B61A1|nr:nuclear factor 7, ovary-like [Stegostoma tigrinum]